VRRFAGERVTALLAGARNASVPLQRPPASATPAPIWGTSYPAPLFAPGDCSISLSATWPFPDYAKTIAGQKSLVSFGCINLIYDLIPSLFPHWAGAYHARRFTMWAQGQIRNADLLLVISDFQRSEVERFIAAHRLPSKPIAILRLGDDLRPNDNRVPGAPRYMPDKPFVLCVSTIDARKNQSCLHLVWRRLAAALGANCPQLLLVGMTHRSGSKTLHAIRNDPLVNGLIVHLADIGDAELAWYYANCLFTVYPSMYEGWGLPVRESLAAGRYCISSNASSLPEACGDLADYFHPADAATCFELVLRAIRQPGYVEQRERRIRTNFRLRGWHTTALQISKLANESTWGRLL
jgi:glycosyltransferase involved in cell wall biosynthesis